MDELTGRYLSIAALTSAGGLAAWTAAACQRARRRGLPGGDAAVWAALALVFLAVAQTKLARVLGWLKGLGAWLRVLAKEHQLYEGRRPLQIVASLVVAAIVLALLAYGAVYLWDYVKRYRLAIGLAGLTVGLGAIRFISLHEVDAWNAQLPWLRVALEVTAGAGASAIAVARLRQLRAEGGHPAPAPAPAAGAGLAQARAGPGRTATATHPTHGRSRGHPAP